MTAITLRPARISDAPAITACIDAAYAPAKARISDLPDVSAGIADDIRDHLVEVADVDGLIAGAFVLIRHEGHGQLANVAVDPAFGGRGIGRALIVRAEELCRSLDLHELRLATHVEMPENVALYAHLGWNETGRGGNKIYMSKSL